MSRLKEADELKKYLSPFTEVHSQPGKNEFFSVNKNGLRELSKARKISLRQAMILCLENGIWPERFRSNRGSLTAAEQAKIVASSVAVLGAGGLGGYVVTLLARLGVGKLAICDGDVFEESNLNRQLLCNLETLGREKALCAAEVAVRINPAVQCTVFADWATSRNLPQILEGADVAMDCLDNLKARYELEAAAKALLIPYVHGALAGWEGFVMTVFPGDPGLAGLYGPDPVEKRDSAESVLGVPTPTPTWVATLQVAELTKVLLGRQSRDNHRLLHLDLTVPTVETLELA
ncbi:HesA/MoeB/ThiF family protein [Dethiosulfatarculus sandiegensis]|uniref:Molybdopterin biosynthesis protein MoeB2 n=1 Tax=Dethiosulfatarculus sandiegensis TaxID=1429043 RepID=A0A0D2K0W4_9BACT|nr:HesA/MoeB/ThiF family protein [Dethiosulfatarculus sandiegensis]KIX15360.1 molybdopterin biosynthesis protein MoeB2 [Dethiosulfatarculus sandiegensis]